MIKEAKSCIITKNQNENAELDSKENYRCRLARYLIFASSTSSASTISADKTKKYS
jgi:hypothetical protein